MAQFNEHFDEFDGMEIFEEDEMLNCDQLNTNMNSNDNQNVPSILQIINEEISSIDFAVKCSKIYDLRTFQNIDDDTNETKETENNKPAEITKYRELVSEYQVVIELDMLSDSKQNVISHQIGALLPKGYVLLNDGIQPNDTKDIMWYDSLHNLLLKKCMIYAKLSNDRMQAQLQDVMPSSKEQMIGF